MSTTRDEAIVRLAAAWTDQLSNADRVDILLEVRNEDWAGEAGWSTLPPHVRRTLASPIPPLPRQPGPEFDTAIRMVLAYRARRYSNEYLESAFVAAGLPRTRVTGDPDSAAPCPCCGRRTLNERGDWDICEVCWWEDDGTDNATAHTHGGPNHITLLQARLNFLRHGIFDPGREDLRPLQKDPARFPHAREFTLSEDGSVIAEAGPDWRAAAD